MSDLFQRRHFPLQTFHGFKIGEQHQQASVSDPVADNGK